MIEWIKLSVNEERRFVVFRECAAVMCFLSCFLSSAFKMVQVRKVVVEYRICGGEEADNTSAAQEI